MKRMYLLCFMALLTLIYAICFTAIKLGLLYLPPLLFGGLRALLGGVSLLLVILYLKQPILPTKQEWKWICWIGVTTTITFFGMFLSPGRTGAGIASILGNMSPLFTVLLAAVVLHEKLSRRSLIALIFGIFGILLISYPDLFGENAYGITGLVLALGASIGAATSNILVKQMHLTKGIVRISAWQLIAGSLPLMLLSWFTEQGKPLIWNITSVGILLFLGVIGTAFITATWYLLIQRHNVGRLSLFLFLIPVFGLVIAGFVFKEPLRGNELFGIGSILLATLFLVFDSLKNRSVS